MTKRLILYFSFLLFCFGVLYAEEADTTLTQDPVDLNELVVKTSVVKRDATKDVITITDAMRKGTTRSIDLLGNVPGVFVNPMTEKVSVNNEKDIPVFVDGSPVSADYANNINPARIARVEIIRVPLGQYSGYPAVVNLILKNDFEGWDVFLSGQGYADCRKTPSYAAHLLANFSFSSKKSNLYGYVTAQDHRSVQAESYTLDILGERQESAPIDNDFTNYIEHGRVLNAFLAWDYKINRKHTLTLQTTITPRALWMKREVPFVVPEFTKFTKDTIPNTDYAVSLIYNGRPNEKLKLHADVLYEYYTENSRTSVLFDDILTDRTDVGNSKHYVRADAKAVYQASDKVSLTLEDYFTNRNYDARNRANDLSLYNGTELRNTLLASVAWAPTRKFDLSASLQYLAVRNSYNSEGRHQVQNTHTPQPDLSLSWNFLPNLWIQARYSYTANYPVLTYLSPVRTLFDNKLYRQGNPDLRHSLTHTAKLDFYFTPWLMLGYQYNKKNDAIFSDYFTENNEYIIQSYINGDSETHKGIIGFEHSSKSFDVRLTGSLSRIQNKTKAETAKPGHAWDINAYLQYTIAPISTFVALNYSISKSKQYYPQIDLESHNERLQLSLLRRFCKNRLSVMLSAYLPIHILSRYDNAEIRTPDYHKTQRFFTGYGDRAISLRVNLTLGNQKSNNIGKAFELETER